MTMTCSLPTRSSQPLGGHSQSRRGPVGCRVDFLGHRGEPSQAKVRGGFLQEGPGQPCQGRGLGRKVTRGETAGAKAPRGEKGLECTQLISFQFRDQSPDCSRQLK